MLSIIKFATSEENSIEPNVFCCTFLLVYTVTNYLRGTLMRYLSLILIRCIKRFTIHQGKKGTRVDRSRTTKERAVRGRRSDVNLSRRYLARCEATFVNFIPTFLFPSLSLGSVLLLRHSPSPFHVVPFSPTLLSPRRESGTSTRKSGADGNAFHRTSLRERFRTRRDTYRVTLILIFLLRTGWQTRRELNPGEEDTFTEDLRHFAIWTILDKPLGKWNQFVLWRRKKRRKKMLLRSRSRVQEAAAE